MKNEKLVTGGPCWVELATSDAAAATAFYTELFGWQAETDPRPEAGGYTMLSLPEGPVAALVPLYAEGQRTAWSVSFAVLDADVTASKVEQAGGKVLMQPMEVFDLGRFAVATDPSGAAFALWQARAFPGAAVLNKPGSLGWVELLTRDAAGCIEFYPKVFGWSVNPSERYTQWGIKGADFGGMLVMGEQFPREVAPHWLPYFSVADLDAVVSTATGRGAGTLMPPTDIGGVRRIAVLRDPQGAPFGVYQAAAQD
ncbi:VOC family protein [Kitasatospora azatica]|uniref:VOC family protein n=1 Tax=Kitasatospora azatica TaxID=58347 RepID=UPI000563E402|nr:VOC family protein [Kitasatospora azatica]